MSSTRPKRSVVSVASRRPKLPNPMSCARIVQPSARAVSAASASARVGRHENHERPQIGVEAALLADDRAATA